MGDYETFTMRLDPDENRRFSVNCARLKKDKAELIREWIESFNDKCDRQYGFIGAEKNKEK